MNEYPVQVTVEYPAQSSRVLAIFSIPFFLVRMILLIPTFIVLYFFGALAFFVAWIAMWVIAFTGQYPRGMHTLVTGALRWQTRANAYLFGLTDRYPPFSTS